MLNSLLIKNFKCFENNQIELRNLNIFTGTNSSGKSTAIQAFLLVCNNAAEPSSPLNGPLIRLGAFDECRNYILNSREFSVGVRSGDESLLIEFVASASDINIAETSNVSFSEKLANLLMFRNGHVFYLPANRVGPEDSYSKNFDNVNHFGARGEYLVDYLYRNRNQTVENSLIEDKASYTLSHQVSYWLRKLFNATLDIKDLGLSNSLSLSYSINGNKIMRPYHVGSGISFSLGIIIACLSAKPNDIVVIENPEIHLHPKAQSNLTQFLCFVAKAGVQIILETHSDHVFNGVRKAVVKKAISIDDVAIHFFELSKESLAQDIRIELDQNGRVENHQSGLFDQFDDDLDAIIGI